MKKRNKILAVAFILLFTGAFFGSGVLKSDGLPSILERSYIVVNDNMTVRWAFVVRTEILSVSQKIALNQVNLNNYSS
ncbi:MAG: hypothetical protein U5K32_11240 [Bacteroidales bacterium]|nr:hypothetical protein [Bacteroidales bacterium]